MIGALFSFSARWIHILQVTALAVGFRPDILALLLEVCRYWSHLNVVLCVSSHEYHGGLLESNDSLTHLCMLRDVCHVCHAPTKGCRTFLSRYRQGRDYKTRCSMCCWIWRNVSSIVELGTLAAFGASKLSSSFEAVQARCR